MEAEEPLDYLQCEEEGGQRHCCKKVVSHLAAAHVVFEVGAVCGLECHDHREGRDDEREGVDCAGDQSVGQSDAAETYCPRFGVGACDEVGGRHPAHIPWAEW